MKYLIAAVMAAVALLSACAGQDPTQPTEGPQTSAEASPDATFEQTPLHLDARAPRGSGVSTMATVTKVPDGDTIHVDAGGKSSDVRIYGIDTPETKKPRTPVKCGGPEASAFAAQVFPIGSHVLLTTDPSQAATDRYGRTLAYVTEPAGGDYSLDVLNRGLGRFAEYGSKIARHDQYAQAQSAAISARRGVWGPPCNGFQK